MAAVISVFTTLCNTVTSVLGVLCPSHVKDFIGKMKWSNFDTTVVYTDKNVNLDGVTTQSVITPEVMSRVTEYSGYDESFKASAEEVEVKSPCDAKSPCEALVKAK